ncbi:MAG: DUF2341 domain-containing protein, partial [Candidatus Aenigmatarchaeota archaeon]
MTKRLISTFIATIILVTLSVGIGVMIYFYFSGYLSKTQSQIEELPIKSMLECSKANIDIFGKAIATGTNLLSNWQYKRSILINNTANSNTLTDYQVLIILNTTELISANKMRDDCGDIRFTDSDGTTLLNYWIEPNTCNTNKTRIWVKVPSIPANDQKTIYMYYGNSLATSLSNGTATFIAFDLKAEGPLGHASVGGHSHSCAIVSNGSVYCWG